MAARESHRLMRDRAPGLPVSMAALLEEGSAALDAHDPVAAGRALTGVLQRVPDCVEARRLLGLVQHIHGDYAQAVVLLRQALVAKPGDALILMNLATSLYAQGEKTVAVSWLKRACAVAPDFAPAWFNLGQMYMLQSRPAGAITALQRALDIEPDHVPARISLAQAQTAMGAIGSAMTTYREVLQAHPAQPRAWLGLAELETGCLTGEDVARLQHVMYLPKTPAHARIALGFALVRALEDQGQFDAALRALHKANGMRYRQLNWNPMSSSAQVDGLVDAFSGPLARAADSSQGEQVIFMVGLPCSGASTAATLLAAHPQVGASHETSVLQQLLDDESRRRDQAFPHWVASATEADWARLGQAYLARTAWSRKKTPRSIDGNLHNWCLVGAALAMLPGARVINARRAPLDTCLACYRQLFGAGEAYTFNLDHMVSLWRDHERLSRHWLQQFPERFINYVYEQWQADPDGYIRGVLDFCGLNQDEVCLAASRAEHIECNRLAAPPDGRHLRATTRTIRYGARLDRLRSLLAAAAGSA
jgi:tetratricopeptide (TPR) repeat protein